MRERRAAAAADQALSSLLNQVSLYPLEGRTAAGTFSLCPESTGSVTGRARLARSDRERRLSIRVLFFLFIHVGAEKKKSPRLLLWLRYAYFSDLGGADVQVLNSVDENCVFVVRLGRGIDLVCRDGACWTEIPPRERRECRRSKDPCPPCQHRQVKSEDDGLGGRAACIRMAGFDRPAGIFDSLWNLYSHLDERDLV